MTLYMKTTTDELELPIAVADSPKELAIMLGMNRGSVASMICKQICGYHKVKIDESRWYPDNDGGLWRYGEDGKVERMY